MADLLADIGQNKEQASEPEGDRASYERLGARMTPVDLPSYVVSKG